MMKIKLQERGFSLVEILLVVMIVGSIVLLVSNLPNSLGLVGTSRNESLARQVGTTLIENLRSTGYANIPNKDESITDSRIATLPNGTGRIVVIDCVTPLCTNSEHSKVVNISIQWRESGKSREVKLSTIISEGGLH